MICRGGIVAGEMVAGPGDRAARRAGRAAPDEPLATIAEPSVPASWHWMLAAAVLLSVGLAMLPGRTSIPPLIESDYCYLLTAADRLYDGFGPTTPPPVAPFQPWEWHADWTFLTRWPMGYPLLVATVRWFTGSTTLQACQWIGIVATALTLVGWFVWVRRCVPRGLTSVLLAAVASGCAVSVAFLLNPSTDLLLIAAVPYTLLLTHRAIGAPQGESGRTRPGVAVVGLAAAGALAGGLFWIRYASAFVPIALMAFLLYMRFTSRTICFRRVGLFGCCAAAPIAALLAVNHMYGSGDSLQEQLNLGTTVSLNLSASLPAEAWWTFTNLGFYDHHRFTHAAYALWPVAVILLALATKPARRKLRAFLADPAVMLSTCTAAALLALLVTSAAVFGDKFHYVGLDRYYLSIRPLYFVLFVGPLLLIPRRVVRATVCVGLLIGASWLVQQEYRRPYDRWRNAGRPETPYGLWGKAFSPGAADLYSWLSAQRNDRLVVVSNFHEYVTLETKIPVLPVPADRNTFDRWLDAIRKARGIDDARVLFVLDPDNRWRSHWIPPPAQLVKEFDLRTRAAESPTVGVDVFEFLSNS